MNSITSETIIKFYEYFYKKRFNSFSYKYKPSEDAIKQINNFVKKLDKFYNLKLIGEDFLWRYFVYQFNYWRNAEIKTFYGKFRINFIIGDKALKRFKNDAYENLWVIDFSEIIEFYGLKKGELIKPKNDVKYKVSHEELVKKMYHNTDKGFFYCIENTTLYNHKHTICLLCNYKNDCKEVLKAKYNKIYEKRGY